MHRRLWNALNQSYFFIRKKDKINVKRKIEGKKTYRKHFGWSARSIKKWSLMHCPLRIFADIPLSSAYWLMCVLSFFFSFSTRSVCVFLWFRIVCFYLFVFVLFYFSPAFDFRCCFLINVFSFSLFIATEQTAQTNINNNVVSVVKQSASCWVYLIIRWFAFLSLFF